MCIIQIDSDVADCGEFEYLDEDLWLEKDGRFLVNLHIILNVKKNLSKINIILHGKLQNPTECSLWSESWNIVDSKMILFNNTFLNDEIRENYYVKGFNALGNNMVEIEGVRCNIVPENNVSARLFDLGLRECECVEVDFKTPLEANKMYAMRFGFYISPPQNKIRHFINKMRYQIHYYTTFSINSADADIINQRNNKCIPINPQNSVIFIVPPPNVEIERPSIFSPYYYEHVWKPFSTILLEKPRIAYRWEVEKIRKSTKPIITDKSIPLSLTFKHFSLNSGHPLIIGILGVIIAFAVAIISNLSYSGIQELKQTKLSLYFAIGSVFVAILIGMVLLVKRFTKDPTEVIAIKDSLANAFCGALESSAFNPERNKRKPND